MHYLINMKKKVNTRQKSIIMVDGALSNKNEDKR